MVPVEILEDVFAYLTRDALDHIEIICLQWRNVIETSKQLIQHRVVRLKYSKKYSDSNPNKLFWMELKSPDGKTIRLVDDPNQQDIPATRVFKNIIIDELREYSKNGIDLLRWMKFFKLAGSRIIVKRVKMVFKEQYRQDKIILRRLHDLLPKYIDAEELIMRLISCELILDRESWMYLDFGKKTILNIQNLRGGFPWDNFPIDNFKEFISGRFMEYPKLNELDMDFYNINRRVIVSSIVQAFCDTDEPQKIFMSISTWSNENLDGIVVASGFVCDDLDPQKYRLHHPKLNWALEATKQNHIDPRVYSQYLIIKSIEL